MKSNLMIDLETMGTGPTAAIIQIGAVAFNDSGSDESHFRADVSLPDAMQTGGTVTAETFLWWLRQDESARAGLQATNRLPLRSALEQLILFVQNNCGYDGPARVWANGPSFDLVIIEGALSRMRLPTPWSFRAHRCVRTIVDLYAIPRIGKPVAHDALADAIEQTRWVQQALDKQAGAAK